MTSDPATGMFSLIFWHLPAPARAVGASNAAVHARLLGNVSVVHCPPPGLVLEELRNSAPPPCSRLPAAYRRAASNCWRRFVTLAPQRRPSPATHRHHALRPRQPNRRAANGTRRSPRSRFDADPPRRLCQVFKQGGEEAGGRPKARRVQAMLMPSPPRRAQSVEAGAVGQGARKAAATSPGTRATTQAVAGVRTPSTRRPRRTGDLRSRHEDTVRSVEGAAL